MPMYDLTCPSHHVQRDQWLHIGERPPCPDCGAPTETLWDAMAAPGVIADSIPGGIMIEHGLCNADGSPRRYDSHSEIRAECKRRNIVPMVDHVGSRGSDKSPHTTKWY